MTKSKKTTLESVNEEAVKRKMSTKEVSEQIEKDINLIENMTNDMKISKKYQRHSIRIRKFYRMKEKITPTSLSAGGRDIERIFMCTPPDTFLYDVLDIYKETTPFPLDFSLMTVMHIISGYLSSKNIKFCTIGKNRKGKITVGKPTNPNLFSILLGPSGSGKTRTIYDIADQIGLKENLLEFGKTGAGTFEAIAENPSGTFYRDEFQELLKQMNNNPNAQEQADLILKGYNGETLEKLTKAVKEQRSVEGQEDFGIIKNPRFSFIGSCTFDGFKVNIQEEMFKNGFCQRFTYTMVKTETDKKRNIFIQGRPENRINDEEVKESWENKILNQKLKPLYYIDNNLSKYLDLIVSNSYLTLNLDPSYSVRIRETMYKYALIFHIIRGRGEFEQIEEEDIFYALRLGYIHCNDLNELFSSLGQSENEIKITEVKKYIEIFKTKNGREPKGYEVSQRFRIIKNTEEAQYLINEIKRREKTIKELERKK